MNTVFCTVDFIEDLTNFDFFGGIDDNIENNIESQCNIDDWKTNKKSKSFLKE